MSHDIPCEWKSCPDRPTKKAIMASATPCQGCGSRHNISIYLCAPHFRDIKTRESCYRMASLVLGPEPLYHLTEIR